MEFDLRGRVAFVTGATSGLGRHFAGVLAKAGAAVAISGRREDRLQTLRSEIEAAGGKCMAIALDVTQAGQITPAFDKAESGLGPIDILVNNAGMSADGPVANISVADFDAVMATNLRGPFLLAQEVGKRMIARGQGGRIINIASITAFRVLQGSAPYCISKAGLTMMTQCMAREWARYDINVNAICPGFIETELNDEWFETEKGKAQIKSFPKRRLQRPEDLDSTLLLLASDASRAITGALFNVDEAQSL
ncbi:MAG TPA: SDR family NAD(P)-dependent oxidoreductase [Rhizomicrobium sp.]|jgi:NAD(P)-dependent dehydrogenase (short-subunit alcohol dehydrogenase family)